MEKNKLKAERFLQNLTIPVYRIKKDNQWYEVRVSEEVVHSVADILFIDKDGVLFGVKNAKIDFYVFKENSDEVADWASGILKNMYTQTKWSELPDDTNLVGSPNVTYCDAFIQYLLSVENLLVLNMNGYKMKKWDPHTIY